MSDSNYRCHSICVICIYAQRPTTFPYGKIIITKDGRRLPAAIIAQITLQCIYILTKIPPSLSNIQCLGALRRLRCFFGPRTILAEFSSLAQDTSLQRRVIIWQRMYTFVEKEEECVWMWVFLANLPLHLQLSPLFLSLLSLPLSTMVKSPPLLQLQQYGERQLHLHPPATPHWNGLHNAPIWSMAITDFI